MAAIIVGQRGRWPANVCVAASAKEASCYCMVHSAYDCVCDAHFRTETCLMSEKPKTSPMVQVFHLPSEHSGS